MKPGGRRLPIARVAVGAVAVAVVAVAGVTVAALAASPAPLVAQAGAVRIVVSDSLGNRIPFALVQLDGSLRRAASDSGVATFEAAPSDSIKLTVRRIGYLAFEGWAVRAPESPTYAVRLAPIAQQLKEVQVRSPSDNRLFRAGFYERMDERIKIPSRSEFFTPEDLDRRNAMRVTHILQGVSFIRIEATNVTQNSASFGMMNVVNGRGKCRATILLDGNVPVGNLEDYMAERDYRESNAGRTHPLGRSAQSPELVVSIDRLVSPEAIAGLEVYASGAQAPDPLRGRVKRLTCPVVVIWTGPRR